MFRGMRRFKQQLSDAECIAVLERGSSGVLALCGDDGYPYAVPLCYLYADGKIIFHGAGPGHKTDAIRRNPKASFCVVDEEQVVPEKYTAYYRSAIAFGTVRLVEDAAEKQAAIDKMAGKYRPGFQEEREREIARTFSQLCVFELKIEHMTGKESMEFVKRRS